MKILFSPSEAKLAGGTEEAFKKDSFLFPELFKHRKKMIDLYQDFVDNADDKMLEKFFGIKQTEAIDYYKSNIYERNTTKVIKRYDGVAFDFLNYSSLHHTHKEYVDENVIIFSNLFGPLLAGDEGLPDYKLKQGEKIGDYAVEKFYRENFSEALDNFLHDEDIIDLRAGFYDKFYKIKKPHLSLKFIKNGKVISHWAKAYRGIVLRHIASKKIQSIDDFMHLEIENLAAIEISQKGFNTEIHYEIVGK
ncbi:MAG: peroxide stress protein YaaA [Sulfurospirillaceae bacterium]|nr:peroxide stress protein YaaA [Sulfurospirillaceae bacterium]